MTSRLAGPRHMHTLLHVVGILQSVLLLLLLLLPPPPTTTTTMMMHSLACWFVAVVQFADCPVLTRVHAALVWTVPAHETVVDAGADVVLGTDTRARVLRAAVVVQDCLHCGETKQVWVSVVIIIITERKQNVHH